VLTFLFMLVMLAHIMPRKSQVPAELQKETQVAVVTEKNNLHSYFAKLMIFTYISHLPKTT
jgi:hypothetical protein